MADLIPEGQFENLLPARWCKWCGDSLPPNIRKRFCNERCAKDNANYLQRERTRREKRCPQCNKLHKKYRYCSEKCAATNRKMQYILRNRRRKARAAECGRIATGLGPK